MLFGNDLNDWKRLGTYNSIGGVTVNAPPGTDGWGVVPVFSGSGDNSSSVLQMFIPLNLVGGKRSIYRRFFRSTWTDWEPLATATPPQEFNLPLAEGMSVGYPCTYYKNQFNEVKIVGAAKGNLSDRVLLATLPEGFRPSGACDRPVLFTISGSSFGGTLNVSTNGEIRCFTLQRNATDVYFEMSFLAAG